MRHLFELLFGCRHKRHTWPLTIKGKTTVSCLECGKRMPYDFTRLGNV